MQEVMSDTLSRMAEINLYCDFLVLVDKSQSQIVYQDESTFRQENSQISFELKKILIANTFLLMYNLLESCVAKTIAELYKHFNNKNIAYSSLNEPYKSLFLKENLSVKEANFNIDKLKNTVDKLILDAINSVPTKLTKEHVFSGNLDAKKIRGIAKVYQIQLSKSNGNKLEDIKYYRKKLAHGEITFSSVGSDKSVKDMLGYKDQLFPYLKKFMKDVENHIKNN